MAPMIASEAPRDSAYNTRTGTTMPIPVKEAQTANDTASKVRLRSIPNDQQPSQKQKSACYGNE